MPKRVDLKKILVIGSGPISIGQGAEFDYSGTEACHSLKEEGYFVILVNSNPATIMTDDITADKIYIEPLEVNSLLSIIDAEQPDAILPTLGGQTGLNLTMEMYNNGLLDRSSVEIIGANIDVIRKAEDRRAFKKLMNELSEPVPESTTVDSFEDALNFVQKTSGFPVIVRPAYTLGGTGGGIANNQESLHNIVSSGLRQSPVSQCLIEKSIAGYKEIEYEIIRDNNDQVIIVCNMENFDPVGVHTGDSIVFAPSQTISDTEHQMLRDAAIKVIRSLDIRGGCNIQFALSQESDEYYIIEVNPRVSRSSALASKATGYPIAKITTKIAVGYNLTEITNPVTSNTTACFEPTLDYVVTKIPRWPFDKFKSADYTLGTQMKSTGEVMAIGRNFEESFQKALRSLDLDTSIIEKELKELDNEIIIKSMAVPNPNMCFFVLEALRRKIPVEAIADATKVNSFFISKIKNIVDMEVQLSGSVDNIDTLVQAKRLGFTDRAIAELWKVKENRVKSLRDQHKIYPVFKMVDTCAGEFESETPYFYSTYDIWNESTPSHGNKVLIIGSGPIRIGQGIEFDYSTVHCVKALQELGYEAVIINNNPSTVSTDFSISDKLYFDPLTKEDILNIIRLEKPIGVIVQFGGQTAINLAKELAEENVNILGTSIQSIDIAEDRKKFSEFLRKHEILQPRGISVTTTKQALNIAAKMKYPVLVRPSYVIGGESMAKIKNKEDFKAYLKKQVKIGIATPLLIDEFIDGIELEVDAISDGKDVFLPGIMQHMERSGVHSGDSITIYPPDSITEKAEEQIREITKSICRELNIIGLINIQFILYNNEIYILEINPRSSRTIPFLSKAINVSLASTGTKVMLGIKLKELNLRILRPNKFFVKFPVFSSSKLKGLDCFSSPEMKSTGEVMADDANLNKALYKGLIASGTSIPKKTGHILISISDDEKDEAVPLIQEFHNKGFHIYATERTGDFINNLNIPVTEILKKDSHNNTIFDFLNKNKIDYLLNLPNSGQTKNSFGSILRELSTINGIKTFTSLDTAKVLLKAIKW